MTNKNTYGRKDWRDAFNDARVGAGYFFSQSGRLKFTPEGYIGFRALERKDSNKLLQEWDRWIRDLRGSTYEHVRIAANLAASMSIDHLDAYYQDRVIADRDITSLENSSKQMADSEQELRLLVAKHREAKTVQEVNTASTLPSVQ
ncbi:hypothetical protein BGZ76_006438, partial [Entomortierella beljakovae]